MSTMWYVLHTKPKRENVVCSYLESQDLEVFYPSIRVKPVNPRASTVRPLFPRYMFIHVDLGQMGFSALRWIPNAIGLVLVGDEPASVADHVIRALKHRVTEIENAGGLVLDGLKPGDPVRITRGPLAGYEALFDMRLSGTERVQLLLNLGGRQVRVQTTSASIEKIAQPCR